MKDHLKRKLSRAAWNAYMRRVCARQRAYIDSTTKNYRVTVAAAVLGMGAESKHYEAAQAKRAATKH